MNNIEDYTEDELRNELKRRQTQEQQDFINNFNIDGITVKDVIVLYFRPWDYWESGSEEYDVDKAFEYRFCLDIHEKLEPFSYGNHNIDRIELREFIPSEFHEKCEDCYEFDGTLEEAKKLLNSFGIERIEEYDE